MIVSSSPEGLVIVRQVDHQEQCGLMADGWGGEGFARPEPWEPIAAAARLHDEGWRRWEEAPEVDAQGAPVNFAEMDRATHVTLYERGIAAARTADARVGLLVSMHGQGLYEGRRGLDGPPPVPRAERPPPVRGFLERQDRVQAELAAAIGPGAALERWAWAGYRLLQAWDVLSLYLTWGALSAGGRGIDLPAVPRSAGDPGEVVRLEPSPGGCAVDPWPFAARRLALPVAARVIPARRYRDHDDLRAALADAPWTELELEARPA